MPDKPLRKELVFPVLLLLLLTFVELVPHLMISPNFPFPGGKDEAWHLQNARTYAEVLWLEPGKHSISELFKSEVEYPPVVYLSSLFSQILLQSESRRAICLGLVPFFLLLNFSLYFLSKELFGTPETGLWAAMLLTSCPLFMGHLESYNLQLPLMALMAPMYLALIKSRSYTKLGPVLFFFALLAFGFLTYVWALMLVWLPAIGFFVYSIIENKGRRFIIVRNASGGVLLFAAIIAPYMAWPGIYQAYAIYLPMINPEITERAGHFAAEGGRLYYLLHLPQTLGLPILILSLWGLIRLPWKNAIPAGWVLSGAGFLLTLSMFTNVYIERILPFCVVAAVVASFGLTSTLPFIKRKSFLILGLAVCLLIVVPSHYATMADRVQIDLQAPLAFLNKRCAPDKQCNLNVFRQDAYWNLHLLQKTDPAFSSLDRLLIKRKHELAGFYTHYLQVHEEDDGFLQVIPPDQRQTAIIEMEKFQSIKPRLRLVYREDYSSKDGLPFVISLWEDPEHFNK